MTLLIGCSTPFNVTVHVRDANDVAIKTAMLEIVGQGITADANSAGDLVVVNARLSGRLAYKITAPGYETLFRSLEFDGGSDNELSVHMRTAGAIHHITLPPVGQHVSVIEGISALDIVGGGLKHADGSDVTGDVDVQMTPFDPVVDTEAPATMLSISGGTLISAGMATITIVQGGESLQPKPGQPLTWSMAVNPALHLIHGRTSSYAMYYVDESKALWVRDDSATLTWTGTEGVDLRWTATLPHLTVWNTDGELGNGECVTGQVTDAFGNPTRSATVTAEGDWGMGVSGGIPGSPQSVCTGYGVSYVNEPGAEESIPNCKSYMTVHAGANQYLLSFPLEDVDQGIREGSAPLYKVTYYPIPVAMPLTISVAASVAGQSVRGSSSTAVTPSVGASCATVNFQLCLNDGQACAGGGLCCNGTCNAQGICAAPVTQPVCVSNGQACRAGTPCCCAATGQDCSTSNYACNWEGTCGPTTCNNDGGACRTSADCCTGTCNAAGRCETPPPAPTCTSNGSACTGATCCCSTSGACTTGGGNACNWQGLCGPPSCGAAGGVCRTSADCCGGGTCLGGICVECADTGASCGGSGDCCAGNLCVEPAPGQSPSGADHTCASCIPTDHGTCSSNSQCCGGLCINSTCRSCVPQGSSSTLGSCCAGLVPSADGTCQACAPTGTACTSGGTCCSGSCSDQLCL